MEMEGKYKGGNQKRITEITLETRAEAFNKTKLPFEKSNLDTYIRGFIIETFSDHELKQDVWWDYYMKLTNRNSTYHPLGRKNKIRYVK